MSDVLEIRSEGEEGVGRVEGVDGRVGRIDYRVREDRVRFL